MNAKRCTENPSGGQRAADRVTHIIINRLRRGKNPEVDEEGFQQVKSRKNIRRNNFGNKTQFSRANAADPRHEVAANTTIAAAPAAALNRPTKETLDPVAGSYLEEALNMSWGVEGPWMGTLIHESTLVCNRRPQPKPWPR